MNLLVVNIQTASQSRTSYTTLIAGAHTVLAVASTLLAGQTGIAFTGGLLAWLVWRLSINSTGVSATMVQVGFWSVVLAWQLTGALLGSTVMAQVLILTFGTWFVGMASTLSASGLFNDDERCGPTD